MADPTLDRLNVEISRRLRAETGYVPSTTRVAGKVAIRPCYINPRTTSNDSTVWRARCGSSATGSPDIGEQRPQDRLAYLTGIPRFSGAIAARSAWAAGSAPSRS